MKTEDTGCFKITGCHLFHQHLSDFQVKCIFPFACLTTQNFEAAQICSLVNEAFSNNLDFLLISFGFLSQILIFIQFLVFLLILPMHLILSILVIYFCFFPIVIFRISWSFPFPFCSLESLLFSSFFFFYSLYYSYYCIIY